MPQADTDHTPRTFLAPTTQVAIPPAGAPLIDLVHAYHRLMAAWADGADTGERERIAGQADGVMRRIIEAYAGTPDLAICKIDMLVDVLAEDYGGTTTLLLLESVRRDLFCQVIAQHHMAAIPAP